MARPLPSQSIFSLSAVRPFRLSPAMVDPKILETFPNPAPQRDYLIEHTHHEFTSLCPMTGHPDFANITVRYIADRKCVELKSLKLYFHAYRNEGIFFEAATNQICNDLGRALQPRELTIIADWKARGGFTSRITAEWRKKKR
jgi:7-cyano-7-deazaguanine reductase